MGASRRAFISALRACHAMFSPRSLAFASCLPLSGPQANYITPHFAKSRAFHSQARSRPATASRPSGSQNRRYVKGLLHAWPGHGPRGRGPYPNPGDRGRARLIGLLRVLASGQCASRMFFFCGFAVSFVLAPPARGPGASRLWPRRGRPVRPRGAPSSRASPHRSSVVHSGAPFGRAGRVPPGPGGPVGTRFVHQCATACAVFLGLRPANQHD